MQIITSPFAHEIPCTVASIGFFDGVHLGHRFLIQELVREARLRAYSSAVITFRNHPRKLVDSSFCPELLSSFEEKMALLAECEVDYCFVLDFTPEIRDLSAREFIRDILSQQLHVRTLLIGYDHRFGKNREENFEDYVRYGKTCDMEVIKEKDYSPDGLHVSSSEIRRKLNAGNVEKANALLGRPYNIRGKVVRGKQLGRTIGFPTANVIPDDPEKLIPCRGVYAAFIEVKGRQWPAMLNIGHRPTVEETGKMSIEAHLFDFKEDLYDQEVNIIFRHYLREEQKMNSLEQLKEQLEKDKENALSLLQR